MIFQRGNPLDYERWAADAGHGGLGLPHCLPYFKRMETCLAGADDVARRRRPAGPRARARPTNPLFGAFFEAAQQAGYPLTDDVNGYRQEGFARFDRNVHRGRRLVRGPRLPAPGDGPARTSTVETLALVTGVRFDGNRAVGVDYLRGGRAAPHGRRRRGHPLRRRDQHPAAAAALRRRRRRATSSRSASTWSHDLPGVGENLQDHLEVYIQYASKQPVSIAPGLRWRSRPKIGYEWLFHRRGLGATNHFEGGGFVRSNDDVDYPNLMFHFLPVAIRYDGSRADRGPRLPGAHRPDVRRHPRLGEDPLAPTRSEHPSMLFNYLSTPTTTAASGSRRSGSPATSSTSRRSRRSTTASSRPGPSVETDEEILDWVASDAETALHPSCTAKMGVDDDVGRRPDDDAGARRRGPARRRRLGLPVRHQRQHLRPGDDGRREGRRPDPRATPRCPPPTCPYYRYRDGSPLYPPGDSRNRERPRAVRTPAMTQTTDRHADQRTRPDERRPALHVEGPLEDLRPARPTRSSAAPDADLSRTELQEKTGCVVGGPATSPSTSPRARSSW